MAKKKHAINHYELQSNYEKMVVDFRERKRLEFDELYEQQVEMATMLVEERYKTFHWRGTVRFSTVCPNGGSYIFGEGGGSCLTIHMDADGFSFQPSQSNERVPLRKLPSKSFSLRVALIKYMNSHKQ